MIKTNIRKIVAIVVSLALIASSGIVFNCEEIQAKVVDVHLSEDTRSDDLKKDDIYNDDWYYIEYTNQKDSPSITVNDAYYDSEYSYIEYTVSDPDGVYYPAEHKDGEEYYSICAALPAYFGIKNKLKNDYSIYGMGLNNCTSSVVGIKYNESGRVSEIKFKIQQKYYDYNNYRLGFGITMYDLKGNRKSAFVANRLPNIRTKKMYVGDKITIDEAYDNSFNYDVNGYIFKFLDKSVVEMDIDNNYISANNRGATSFIAEDVKHGELKNYCEFIVYQKLKDCNITLSESTYVYDGKPKTPTVSVKTANETLVEGIDYTVEYKNNTNIGTASVEIKGISDRYVEGTVTKKFEISKANSKPKGYLSSTNDIASSQMVTLNMTDDDGISGYYWGTSSNYTENTYENFTGTSTTKTVSNSGTYYLTVVDTKGNKSEETSITFYKTTLDSKGGIIGTTNILTKSGNKITLPIPIKSGNTFNGWSSSSSAASGNVTDIVVNSSTTYYATWLENANKFKWGISNWNFNNSSYQGYFEDTTYANQIDSTYLEKLKKNLTNTEYDAIFNTSYGWLYDRFAGSCYGMSSTTLLADKGYMTYNSYKSGATSLYQLSYPKLDKNISSLITYYQMLQVKDVIQQQYRTIPSKTNKENIKKIISLLDNNNIVLLGFKKSGWGGHAIVAYDYEYGSYTWNGISYQGCIKICDPNSSTDYNDKCNIYFNTSTYNWVIPYYGENTITSVSGAKFNYIGADVNEINKGGFLTGNASNTVTVSNYVARLDAMSVSNNRSMVKVEKSNGVYSNKAGATDDIVEDDSFVLGSESEGMIGYTLFDANSAYRLAQKNAEKLDLVMNYQDCSLRAMSKAGKSVVFDKEGLVEIEGESADYTISMTYNDNCPMDWFTVSISGTNGNNVSLQKVENGYLLSGNYLKNINIMANNKESNVKSTFTTDCKNMLIYEKSNKLLGAKVDLDGNGSFETELENVNKSEETTNKSQIEETTTNEKNKETTNESKNNKDTIKSKKPKRVSSCKVKSISKKKIRISWKRMKADGFEIQYSLNNSFTKRKKTKKCHRLKNVVMIKNLKRKKIYYVRVRAYRLLTSKKYIYGSWSKVKKCRVK